MNKILIANRGEIARRVMRTAKAMGMATVAVYSEADADMPFVADADEAYCIGPAESSKSYLRMDEIIRVAKLAGCNLIHPGYGFLSENADFARAVEQAGITFVGPTPEAIVLMGDKVAAKKLAEEHQVPLVPGSTSPVASVEEAKQYCSGIGFPVLLKAKAGGGGKGMRVVHQESELAEAFERAGSEALSAFGNSEVFVERYVQNPKHIEVQVMADSHGNVLHLWDRECSVQRRHQKLIEEAPSVSVPDGVKQKMYAAAVRLAKACGYRGAGTVEFLYDETGEFYFLEMNTRLQVEHPVTEQVTGLDLVEYQLRVAQGEVLPISQEEVKCNGHSIEVRVNAENPFQDFMPEIGLIRSYSEPSGPGVRVDSGYERGKEVPVYYDAMLAKVIVHAQDREEAILRAIKACDHMHLGPMQTTIPFTTYTLKSEEFKDASYSTRYVERALPDFLKASVLNSDDAMAGAILRELDAPETTFERPADPAWLSRADRG